MGQELHGRVVKLVPLGVFVQVTDGIGGLVHLRELASTLVESPSDVVRTGDEVTVEAPRQAVAGVSVGWPATGPRWSFPASYAARLHPSPAARDGWGVTRRAGSPCTGTPRRRCPKR
ncbi:S1 RNA-binding domain-containing protein [Streptomyces microflavus]|uniref:S1 RNA-binding domain-containing protein n=1 Tax=Streptomyces microflavus TaxID=1919 RepID=A0A6N9V1F6_STRMI|nr:S1 RNA-binding domain-containing protein [Streptomyces microflavus]